jgi:hypothetical protein
MQSYTLNLLISSTPLSSPRKGALAPKARLGWFFASFSAAHGGACWRC